MFHFGTRRDDLFQLSGTDLSGDFVHGGRGYDILALTSVGGYTFDKNSYWALRGIEEVDFSGISGRLDITVDAAMLDQANNDRLSLKRGSLPRVSCFSKAPAAFNCQII